MPQFIDCYVMPKVYQRSAVKRFSLVLIILIYNTQSLQSVKQSSVAWSPFTWPDYMDSTNDHNNNRFYSSSGHFQAHKSARLRISDLSSSSVRSSFKYFSSDTSSVSSESGVEMRKTYTNESSEEILDLVDQVTSGQKCNGRGATSSSPSQSILRSSTFNFARDPINSNGNHDKYIPSPSMDIPPKLIRFRYNLTSARVELLNAILIEYLSEKDKRDLLKKAFPKMIDLDENIVRARVVWIHESSLSLEKGTQNDQSGLKSVYYYTVRKKRSVFTANSTGSISGREPWLQLNLKSDEDKTLFEKLITEAKHYKIRSSFSEPCPKFANWTIAYFSCDLKKWLFSYTSLIITESTDYCMLKGFISVDIDINKVDINQCDINDYEKVSQLQIGFHPNPYMDVAIPLYGTHKCHRPSSKCIFRPGHGWTRGGYFCECRDGYFAPSASYTSGQKSRSFNGSEVEKAWSEKIHKDSPQYDMIYVCQRCSEGCETCIDGSACLSSYNWAFRVSLLTISILCIIFTGILAGYIYKYRKLKVFKVASPIFLCITLLGCAIMYSEMAAIFPVLTTSACIATKVTRNMGFCITYSALLLKTWRVSLTYRVKSAHKLKLTDKQLLQWLFPILLVMAIYLGTWTISAPPEPIYITDWNSLKFKICDYNWWDHSLVIGEFLFLLWGIKVCYNVRNAESFFNEAKYITWAIYNIAVVNIIMILVHLLILPNAGPDGKYFFGFIRTQLSTTITIILIFGPKFYRVIKGQGDSWDNRVRARGVNASFSLNGVGLVHEETTDLYQENEELKEEIHKLATQIELMKLMQMEINNRHLKSKHGTSGHHILPAVTITANPASATSVTQSPIVKAVYSRFDANDAPSPRISPAAELASERV